MITQFRNYRFYIVLTADIVIFVMAIFIAYLLRFDFMLTPLYRHQILQLLPFLIPGKVIIFFLLNSYRGMWRYTTLNDLWWLAQASLAAMILFLISVSLLFPSQGFPRSVILIDGLLTFIMSSTLRLGIRFLYTYRNTPNWLPFGLSRSNGLKSATKSIMIVGAGAAGEKMYLEILENQRLNYHVIGFLDDDRSKWGRSLHRLKVFGSIEMLPNIIKLKKVDEVLIAIPSATGEQMRRITHICKSCNVPYRTLPEIGAIIDGKVSIKNLRDVRYEDLLRRLPVNLDNQNISTYLRDKRVLITGAGGSIGSELCRQVIRFRPAELIMVDISEANLFSIQMELRHELNFNHYHCLLGRVQNRSLMERAFNQYQPQVVFHASAYKHVPLLEKNPWEAIFNNVLSSRTVMDLSLKYGVERFVLVSTDKAVRPTNVMGASKRVAELIMQSRQGKNTRFMAVRFGNVIGSSGSVLPLFRRQLEKGGPITVTHPQVTRYFMTISEAAQLILQAGSIGEGGEIFILEMGTPVKIVKMAEELVRLSGKEPGKDVEIVFTGLRAGEKLYEELITQGEGIVATGHEKIMVLRTNGWNGRKSQKDFYQWLNGAVEALIQVADKQDANAIKGKLSEIVPEYVPQQDVRCILEASPAQTRGERSLSINRQFRESSANNAPRSGAIKKVY
jgi:FlaA1/EpsC-like NDP-sugar epimerase